MVFDRTYARCYDAIYRDKNYESECDMLERIFSRRGLAPSTILDLGCGTGRHAVTLARRGYSVTGVDCSHEMLKIASDRARRLSCEVTFLQQDIRALQINEHFEAAVAMFAVMGYLWTNDSLLEGLRGILSHLAPGGLFIFDCWYGPAVAAHRPEERLQRFGGAEGEEVVRMVNPRMDSRLHIVDVNYETLVIAQGGVVSREHETHRMRYFYPMEVHMALETCGFQEVAIGVFGEPERAPTEDDWNIVVSARRPAEIVDPRTVSREASGRVREDDE